MEMYSKMDGSTPVSPALGGVWEIQKKGRIDDQHKKNRKKGKENKEEEKEFEDGLVVEEQGTMEASEKEVDEDKKDNDLKDDNPSEARKIDIFI